MDLSTHTMTVQDEDFVLLSDTDIQGYGEDFLPLSNDKILRIQKWLAPTD